MGWVQFLFLTLCLVAALWFVARFDKATLLFVGAALFVAFAGYAWQGRPGLVGAPKRAVAQQRMPDSAFAQMRGEMLGRFDSGGRWLGLSEMYARSGDTYSAAQVIRSGIRNEPRNSDLWIGYGTALVQHSGGLMTPAARIAFARAEQLAPGHPATRFFYGLAIAQGGQLEEAERLWTELLATSPAGASWRPMVEQRLQMLREYRRSAAASGAAPPAAQPVQPSTDQTR